jgi:UDP-glucuronate 4-epimerase
MTRRTLVTGAAGFIGSHLCQALLERGDEVMGVDNFDPYYDPAIKRENLVFLLAHPRFCLVEEDIREAAAMSALFDGYRPQVVVHLAARAGVRPSLKNPAAYVRTNEEGTVNLLEASRLSGVSHFVFGSSSSVYGADCPTPFSEDSAAILPLSPYAASKRANELYCATYNHLYGLPVTSLRFFTVYGPRQRPEMAIHLFTRQISEGEGITLYGDGTSQRDYTYVDDIIAGVVAAIDKPGGVQVFNLGGERTVSLLELVRKISELLGREPRIRWLPDQPGDVPITWANVARARTQLGYEPRVPIDEGLRHFVAWFQHRSRNESLARAV